MRRLRLSLVGAVILVLLGGLAGVALAQDDATLGPMRASRFTGTWSEQISGVGPDQFEWTSGPGYGESLGNESVGIFEASDPRISGTWTQVNNLRAFPIDVAADDHAVVWTSTVRIENEDGAWSGAVDGFHNGSLSREWYRLAGEGAYAGLTAVVRWVEEGDAYEGVIIPGDPPDYPDPITAASEEAGEATAADEVTVEATEQPEATEQSQGSADEDGDLSGTSVYIDGLRTWQYWKGEDTIYELEMSDPRANGTYTEWGATIVGNGYDGGSMRPSLVGLMEVTLVNDEGSWSGLQSAVWDDDMGWRLTAWLAGEDAYEGLSLYLHAHRFPVYSTPEMDFDGVIFDGEPPVMFEAVSFPAD